MIKYFCYLFTITITVLLLTELGILQNTDFTDAVNGTTASLALIKVCEIENKNQEE